MSRPWEVGESCESTVFTFNSLLRLLPLLPAPRKWGPLMLSQKAQQREHGDDRVRLLELLTAEMRTLGSGSSCLGSAHSDTRL